MKYQSKQELLDDIQSEHEMLRRNLAEIPLDCWSVPGVWGDDWTLLDLVAHLAEWQAMFLRWYEEGQQGKSPEMPAPGYKWNETPRLNQAIWEKHRLRSHHAIQADFDSTYGRIVEIVQVLSDEQVLEPGHFPWTGRHPLVATVRPNTVSHYRFARKAIRRWRKNPSRRNTRGG